MAFEMSSFHALPKGAFGNLRHPFWVTILVLMMDDKIDFVMGNSLSSLDRRI